MRILIVIPARYNSSRLPGKPLAKINGKEMLLRVWNISERVVAKFSAGMVACVVATEDERIMNFCQEHAIPCYMTSAKCVNGTERVLEVVTKNEMNPEFIINLQADNPFCPWWFVVAIINEYLNNSDVNIVTAATTMSWDELEKMREQKKHAPFSGTCVIVHPQTKKALWFSKNIIPAIRKEEDYRLEHAKSPVLRHIGLYGYTRKTLTQIASLPETNYEHLEGLEQLRFLENDISIHVVNVDYGKYVGMSGIDAKEDLLLAENLWQQQGDII